MSARVLEVVMNGMPKNLASQGWELQKTDAAPPRYHAFNDDLRADLGPFPTIDEAQAAAWNYKDPEAEEAAAVREEATGVHAPAASEGPATEERPSYSDGEEMMLSVDEIRTDGGTQPRALFEDEVVEQYKDAKASGAEFPPIDVFWDGEYHWLADGFYRTEATKRLHGESADAGDISIRSRIHLGTQRDAILFSLSANAAHGQPRTNADKRRAVITMLMDNEWQQLSDSEIARRCQVSQPFVGNVRKELTTQNVLSEQTARRGADGVVRDTSNIGRRSEEEKETIAREERETSPDLFDADDAGGAQESLQPEFTEATEDELAGQSERREVAEASGDWSTDDVVAAIKKTPGRFLFRGQLEELGCSYAAILSALHEGLIDQPETGKYTIAGQVADSPSASKSPASAPAPKPKPSIEEILKGRMLTLSFTWIPALKGRVNVTINATMDKTKAARHAVDSDEIRGFSQPVMNLILDHLQGKFAPKKKPGKSKPKAAPRPKSSNRRKVVAKRQAPKKAPTKKKAATKTKARRKK